MHRARFGIAVLALFGWSIIAQAGVLDAIRAGAAIQCRPALKMYCANVHVACAGRSAFAARHLTIEPLPGAYALHYAGSQVDALPTPVAATAAGVWEARAQSLILRPTRGPDYVKIHADGRYAERTYSFGPALMAHGTCTNISNQ